MLNNTIEINEKLNKNAAEMSVVNIEFAVFLMQFFNVCIVFFNIFLCFPLRFSVSIIDVSVCSFGPRIFCYICRQKLKTMQLNICRQN